jgi:hypothetical protein
MPRSCRSKGASSGRASLADGAEDRHGEAAVGSHEQIDDERSVSEDGGGDEQRCEGCSVALAAAKQHNVADRRTRSSRRGHYRS